QKSQSVTARPSATIIQAMWSSRLAWQISIFMGLQSFVFYILAAWLPAMLQSWGMPAERAGWMLSDVQMGMVPIMLFGPMLAGRMKSLKALIWLAFVLLFGGLTMIVIWKTEFIIAAVLLVGIAAGLAYALAMMFFVLRT